jgi:hypothetical protein
MNADQLRRLAGRVAAVIAEMNEAQRRMTELRLSQDRYLLRPDLAPDTYDEFLARTSGTARREPSASERARGQRGCPW